VHVGQLPEGAQSPALAVVFALGAADQIIADQVRFTRSGDDLSVATDAWNAAKQGAFKRRALGFGRCRPGVVASAAVGINAPAASNPRWPHRRRALADG
jgi:hypothetical protein